MSYTAILRDAISYWERKRLIYNAVLAVLVIVCWGADIAAAGPRQWIGAAVALLLLASIANLLYCLAYPVDVVLQMTRFQPYWKRTRWLLFTSGVVIASTLALWVMLSQGMA